MTPKEKTKKTPISLVQNMPLFPLWLGFLFSKEGLPLQGALLSK